MYDYLIVGSGFFGSVFAREMTDVGKKCLIIDKRNHIGGNSYTENIEEINIHKYGPHIFHTSDDTIWEWMNRFCQFNHFVNRPKVSYKSKIYSFPINLFTLYQIFGVNTPSQANQILEAKKIKIKNPSNLEEWILSQVGEELYEIFIKGYTTKQWGKSPKELPASIIRRLPIRLTFDDNYYKDKYQGIPINGYTNAFNRILDGIEYRLNTDYFKDKEYFDSIASKVVYTGPIDLFYEYKFGKLEYRSLYFENQILEMQDYQGNACINYTEKEVPYTRIVEHKHFEFGTQKNTVITREYPRNEGEPYYPINDDVNNKRFDRYKLLMQAENKYIFGGRLTDYKYYDMHQVIGSALKKSAEEKTKLSL